MPKHLIRLGAPSPKPLRSGAHPLGVPGLSPINQARVDSANTLYKLTLDVTLHCLAKGIIENPANSWTRAVFVALLVRDYDDSAKRLCNSLQPVLFHSCCHGGQRKKATQWLSTPDLFASLAAECQGEHPHEAAYPKLLAQRVTAGPPVQRVGALHSPEEFLLRAMGTKHPADVVSPLDKVAAETMDKIMGMDPRLLTVERKKALLSAKVSSLKLAASEKELHGGHGPMRAASGRG